MTVYESPKGEMIALPFVLHGFTQQPSQACCSVWKGSLMTLKIRHDQTSMKVLGVVLVDAQIIEDGIDVPRDQQEFDLMINDIFNTLNEFC